MTDIERLEKFIRQRKKWRYWATARDTTDLQVLRRKERIMWEAMFLTNLCLLYIVGYPHCFKSAYLDVAACFLGFTGYLVVGASRTASLREIFERTAVQNATDLLDQLKRQDAAAAQQEKLPSAVPSGKGENTTDIQRLEKFIRQRKKWNVWATPRDATDLQVLRRKERIMWDGIILSGLCLVGMIHYPVSPRDLHLILAALLLGTAFYLYVELRRTNVLAEIFQRTAIQKAEDAVNELKRRDADPASQDKPAS